MSLTLYCHPLASFCHKVLIALYENDTPFTSHLVDLMDEAAAANFKAIWPLRKFSVLRDDTRSQTITESSIIIEYLDRHYPGRTRLVPDDPDLAKQTRMQDRFFDLYVHLPMQKIVGDRLRPPDQKDSFGVEEARAQLKTSLGMIDQHMATKTWATGDTFSMADCAAAPALFYVDKVMPLGETYPNAAAYLDRLMQRPSYARALKEAQPYFKLFPQ